MTDRQDELVTAMFDSIAAALQALSDRLDLVTHVINGLIDDVYEDAESAEAPGFEGELKAAPTIADASPDEEELTDDDETPEQEAERLRAEAIAAAEAANEG